MQQYITDLVSYFYLRMPAATKSEPRWTRRKHARPEEITAAALESFVERGYAATRLEDVAARAGISKGTLYLYFANKEDLFKAVVREALVARWSNSAARSTSTRAAASSCCRSW
jgi:AcrR family transcriptional regulator